MCFKCSYVYFSVCTKACLHSEFALGSLNVYGQMSTRFPGFQAKPSPHSATPDTGSQPILSSYRMRQCRTSADISRREDRLLPPYSDTDRQGKTRCLADRVSWIGTLSSVSICPRWSTLWTAQRESERGGETLPACHSPQSTPRRICRDVSVRVSDANGFSSSTSGLQGTT